MKKLVGTLLALVMVLCLMTAVAEPLNLTMYFPVNVGGSAAALIDAMTQDFNTEHPDIHVEAVYTGNYDDTVTAIQSAIQGGNAPDLFVSLATQRFTMADTKMAMPLDDLIAADPEGQAFVDDFIDGFMLDSYVDGSIYSIPFQRSTMVMFYNKDAFREVGLDPEQPPKNWDELVEYDKKLTNDKRKGVGLALNSGSAQWGFTGFSLQNCTNGVGLMSADGKHVYFNTPENVEALQFWLDLQNKYEIMNKGIVQWTDLPTQFLAGEVAMIYHTTGNLTNIRNNATLISACASSRPAGSGARRPAAATSTSPTASPRSARRRLGNSSSSAAPPSAPRSGPSTPAMWPPANPATRPSCSRTTMRNSRRRWLLMNSSSTLSPS